MFRKRFKITKHIPLLHLSLDQNFMPYKNLCEILKTQTCYYTCHGVDKHFTSLQLYFVK